MINKNKTTLILGAYGAIGKNLVSLMDKEGYNLLYPTKKMCNFLDRDSFEIYFANNQPTYVINALARKTNINLCSSEPASICRDTLRMNMAVLEMCRKYKVEKLVNIICSCAYPDGKEELFEDEFWDGSPHKSVLAHALAKRSVYFLGHSYCEQYKINVITLCLNNLYGTNTWATPTSLKFLDSILVKVVDAQLNKIRKVSLWGTGNPRREVIHAKDAARGILRAFELYNDPELLNIGTGVELSIREYADLVKKACKWKGEFVWDETKKDGQMSKRFNVDKQRDVLNEWYPETDLFAGIKDTAESYRRYIESVERRSYPLA